MTRETERKFLLAADSLQNGNTSYEMNQLTWKINNIARADGRYLKIDYYSSGKVKALFHPLETQDPIKRFEFRYHQDYTEVFDALDQITLYHFDDHQRISRISYLEDGQSIRQDHFDWSSKKGENGWLKSKSIRSGNQIHYRKTFHYDSRGNMIAEVLFGNLTGKLGETSTSPEN